MTTIERSFCQTRPANFVGRSGQVRYGGIRRSNASPRPPCDGTPSASVWPSPRQTPGPPRPHPSDRTPPYATTKRVGAPLAWTSSSDLDNTYNRRFIVNDTVNLGYIKSLGMKTFIRYTRKSDISDNISLEFVHADQKTCQIYPKSDIHMSED